VIKLIIIRKVRSEGLRFSPAISYLFKHLLTLLEMMENITKLENRYIDGLKRDGRGKNEF
jgi:hypothetical protein